MPRVTTPSRNERLTCQLAVVAYADDLGIVPDVEPYHEREYQRGEGIQC